MLILFIYLSLLPYICCVTFDDELVERTAGLEEFPSVFSRKLGDLANEKSLSKYDVGELAFESLIERLTEFSWFPYINIYLSDTLKVSPGNVTELRRAKVSRIINNMPKYSIDQFWEASFKTLLFNVGSSVLQKTYDDVIKKLQDIYGYFRRDIESEFIKANATGGYIFHIYDKLLPIISNLQKNKTNELPINFGINKTKAEFLAGKTLDAINDDIAKFIFHSIHNAEQKVTSNDVIIKLMRRLQLFQSSLRHWSYTCAVYPGKTFEELNVDNISQKCFGVTMNDAAFSLYGINDTSSLSAFTMLEVTQLANNTDNNNDGLINADVLLSDAIKGVEKVRSISEKPYVYIAREAGLTLTQMKENTIGHAVSVFLNIPWNLFAKIYNIQSWVSTQMNRILFREISIEDVSEKELRSLSLKMITEIFENPAMPKNRITENFESSMRYLSKVPISTLQSIFEITEADIQKYSLYQLSNVIFGTQISQFLKIYGIPASKLAFYSKALIRDYGLLLVINERDIKHFSINQLIQQTMMDAIYADVMLMSPNQLIATRYSNVTERYILSIPQIAHEFHDGVTSFQSFRDYIRRWSNSEAVARTLLEKDIFDLSKLILHTVNDTGNMRIIEIVNSLIATFGAPCNTTEKLHCQKLQVCKQTDLGSRCQCIEGYRFSGPDTCTDLDECLFTKVTCDENASCNNTLGSYKCYCNNGFYGTGQECYNIDECLSGQHKCNQNAVCKDTKGSYTCECKQGYTGDGFNCNDINECSTGNTNCHRNADCKNTVGSYECVCKPGYEGDGINNCRDIDECVNATLHRCPKHSVCVNKEGSHECECIGGFYKENDLCHQCLQGEGYCHINAECFQNPIENYCVCKSGFKGNGTFCEDFNECKNQNPCLHGKCKNHIGSYSCLCDPGFRANDANRVCLDIDECAEAAQKNIQLCNGTYAECVNVAGTYSCVSNAPNTQAKIALGVTVPLLLLVVVMVMLFRRMRVKYKGKKELSAFDQRLNALSAFNNKGFQIDEKDSKVLTPTYVAEAESKVSHPKNFTERTLRYIFTKDKNNQNKNDGDKPNFDDGGEKNGMSEKEKEAANIV